MGRAESARAVGARLEDGVSVLLVGSAGIGKTHFLRSVAGAATVPVLRAVASRIAARIPFGAIAPFVPPDVLARPTAAERVAAVSAWFAAQPVQVLLVIDDADLLDDESMLVVHHLLVTRSASVIAAVRTTPADVGSTSFAAWRDDGLLELVALAPLEQEEVAAVVETHLGGVLAPALLRAIHTASEGNPLLVDELVRHNLAAGRIVKRAGVWSATDLSAPASVIELLHMRLAPLGDEARRALTLVALAGPLAESTIADIAGRAGLAEVTAIGLLTPTRPGVLGAFHPVLAEVVAGVASDEERVALLVSAVDAVLSAPDAGADWTVPLASWMVALAAHDAVGPERLLDVATLMVSNMRPDLGERLATAAGDAGGERGRALLARTRAMQGKLAADGQRIDTDAFEAALGAIEAFMLGVVGLDLTKVAIERASGSVAGTAAVELHMVELGFLLFSGRADTSAIDQLVRLVDQHAGTSMACVAGASAIAGLVEVGRFDEAIRVGQVMIDSGALENAFHSMQQALSTSESLFRLGRCDAAQALARERFVDGPGAGSPTAAVFGGALRAQIALAAGRPAGAAQEFASVLAALQGLDAAGIGSWAIRGLRFARVWSGERGAIDDVPPPLPPQGRFQRFACRWFDVQTELVAGSLRASHRSAVDLAHEAAAAGHWFEALQAAHLACCVSPTATLADWVADLATRCDGDLVTVLATHAAALARSDASTLERAAEGFVVAGRAATAIEAYEQAAAAARHSGLRDAARRAAAAAQQLRDLGVCELRPAARLAAAHGLTPRELEIAVLAASGHANREVAEIVGLSARTVETHLQRAYAKLQVHDRAGLRGLGLGEAVTFA
jgi:DNA-binding CsgD family transcriptional regulator